MNVINARAFFFAVARKSIIIEADNRYSRGGWLDQPTHIQTVTNCSII